MTNIGELNKKLDDAIFTGRAMEAFEELYDDDVVMQENTEPEHRGKALNRKREQEFFATVEQFHGGGAKFQAGGQGGHGGGERAELRDEQAAHPGPGDEAQLGLVRAHPVQAALRWPAAAIGAGLRDSRSP